jgi:hypothetical protein
MCIRLFADFLVLCAALEIGLWVATRGGTISVDHVYEEPGVSGALSLVSGRDGFWVLDVRTRVYADSPPGPTPPQASIWYLSTAGDPRWEDRLSAAQTGPRRFGFSSHVRHTEWTGTYSELGTGRLNKATLTKDERVMRVPHAAIVAGLLLLPAGRIWFAVRARRRRTAIGPTLPIALGRRCLGLAALASALLLAFAVWRWRGGPMISLSCTTRWNGRTPASLRNCYCKRAVSFTRDGWEVERVLVVGGGEEPRVPDDVHRHFAGINVTDEGEVRSPRATGAEARFLGFCFAHEDTTMGVGFGPPSIRRVGRALVVPHWAVVVVALALPCLWLLGFREPVLRARRRRLGQCVSCGYDLRASPGRCPECGASCNGQAGAEGSLVNR